MPYQYRINQITFSDTKTLNLPNLTVLVGPNNSGKSRALKDIINLTCSTNKNVVAVTHALQAFPANAQELASSYGIAPSPNSDGQITFRFLNPRLNQEVNIGYGDSHQWPDGFDIYVKKPGPFQPHFASQLTALLTTEDRLKLIAKNESGSDPHQAANLLQVLYAAGREKELEVRKIVTDAFPGIEIALDFTVPQKLEFKVGKGFSSLPPDPRDARTVLIKCERLDDHGDGLRSYVAIVVALTALKRSVFLIDEPEAFLHPPQAFRLGQFIASQASQDKQIILATHSADVLRGIIFKTNEALIVRINRTSEKNVVNPLDPGELKTLVLDPLLSAAGVLNGLFYSGVVVTEADADSRLYQSLSNKMNPSLDIHFVNADNKQTVPKVLAPYKRLGVRCAGIVDIDALNDPTEFTRQLEAAGISGAQLEEAKNARQKIDNEVRATPSSVWLEMVVNRISEMKSLAEVALAEKPEAHEKALKQIRRELERLKADASDWHLIKKGGATILKESRAEFDKLYQLCSAAGLFINPCGELEASLSEHGIEWQSDKRSWINRALQLLPKLEVNLSLQPWKLVSEVHSYLQKT